jgi:hypothetical protein
MVDSVQSLQARSAVHQSRARTDDRAGRTASARQAFRDRFEREVDPDDKLDPAERAIRAEHARKAYYANLAARSAAVRRRRSRARNSKNGKTA